VIIERKEAYYDRIITNDVPVINGDARHEETLEQAGITRAATVVGAIDNAKTNIQTAVVAREYNPAVRLIVRVGNEMDKTLAEGVGIDEIIIPEVVSGEEVSNTITGMNPNE
jgi:voltage-gated potassium channel